MIKLKNMVISYQQPLLEIDEINFLKGNLTCISGESGSGKTTLLNVLALKKEITQGEYLLDEQPIDTSMKNQIAYVMQNCEDNFITDLTCYENLKLQLEIYQSLQSVETLLKYVHLDISSHTYPLQLSGGERKKFALAMALAKDTDIILCDEITASLDEENSLEIVKLLAQLAHQLKKYVIFSSHDHLIYPLCDTIYNIQDLHIKQLKQTPTQEVKQPIQIKKTRINSCAYSLLIGGKLKRNFFKNGLIILLSSLLVVMSCLGIQAQKQYVTHSKALYDLIGDNQYFVTTGSFVATFEDPVFEDHSVNEYLKQQSEIEAIYPFKQFYIDRYIYDINSIIQTDQYVAPQRVGSLASQYDGMLQVKVTTDGESKMIDRNHNDIEEVNQFSMIYPFYPQQQIEKKCEVVSDFGEVYISKGLAYQLGINNLDKETTISYPVAIPIAEFNFTSQQGTDEKNSIRYVMSVVQEMEFKVKGILKPEYLQTSSQYDLYMDYQQMDQIIAQAQEKIQYIDAITYELNNTMESKQQLTQLLVQKGFSEQFASSSFNQYQNISTQDDTPIQLSYSLQPLNPNAYCFFSNKTINLNQMQEELHEMNSQYYLLNQAKNTQLMMEGYIQDHQFSSIYIYMIDITIVLMLIVYSFLNYDYFKRDKTPLKNIGFLRKTTIKYILLEGLVYAIMMAVVSLILLFTLTQISLKAGFLMKLFGFNQFIIFNILYIITLSLIFAFGSRLISLIKIKRGEQNEKN